MPQTNVVVLGAGVIGLTTALLLSRDERYSVTVIAKHMPGDYDSVEYASPWYDPLHPPRRHAESWTDPYHDGLGQAPALSLQPTQPIPNKSNSVGAEGTPAQQYERDTGPILFRLCREVPESGIVFNQCTIYNRHKDASTPIGQWFAAAVSPSPWFTSIVEDFRVLPRSELPADVDSASTFRTVCINTAVYLPWLLGQCLAHGAVVRRGTVAHVAEAGALHHSGNRTDIIVNCVGLGARALGGVKDGLVYPARGQTVLVRQEPMQMTTVSGTDDGPEEVVYTMTRAGGGGTILGGCLQANNWNAQVDLNLANRIMKRCVALVPKLTDGKGYEALDVVKHNVGMRPLREGGPRVDVDTVNGFRVVHQYGHGGGGYQMSWGSAKEAVRLVNQLRGERSRL
ncbi:D-amino-acid oxidase [Pseudovirgaria hyperparasitica]|uniref:D-amino-acid oxidase n=1 Tax=Pseudovirgaria hyperparasitica TaxID=470096 RepID=A0A6A6W2S1_9PEZI|nr:D-amino-acid oxidase [Pseudovirgaria hyperparasitica]KAF2755331.1 D-amino-acid oxidase [Pseudovirgaria hyperparasitica]